MKKNKTVFACLILTIGTGTAVTRAQNTFPASGNVGIGTATPQARLHVVGNQLFIQNSGEARLRLFNNGGQAEWVLGQRSATEHNFSLSRKIASAETDFISITPQGRFHIAGPEYLYLLNSGGVIVGREFGGNGNLQVQGNLIMNGPSQYILGSGRLHTNGPEYLYVLNAAGMVIGKEGGGTGNLQVQGTVLASKVKVAVTYGANWNFAAAGSKPAYQGWADYVFNSDYNLKPLDEVEKYIKTHKHLEGIPTSAEVEKEGIDVAPVTAKLLEKIEELTLYMIELKKEVDLLKQSKKQQKNKCTQ